MEVEEIIGDYTALREAERRAASCKRKKKEVALFEYDLGYNLCKLSDEIKSGEYEISPYHTFYVYEPKEREIQALRFRDRVVQNCICNKLLRPYFEPRLIFDNAACRVNKGTHFAQGRLTEFLRRFYQKNGTNGYVLKIDVAKYFNSIDHAALKKRCAKMPDGMRELVHRIIDSYESTPGKGLPMGNQSSQWLALYYLDGMDRLIKERYRIKYYTRYMDDCILVHHDKEYLRKILKELTEYASTELKLSFNSKTQITPLSQGVEYLGFRFYLTESGKVIRRLRSSAKKRLKDNMKRIQWEYKTGRMDIEDVRNRLNSYRAHLAHGHTYFLRKNTLAKAVFVRRSAMDDEKN